LLLAYFSHARPASGGNSLLERAAIGAPAPAASGAATQIPAPGAPAAPSAGAPASAPAAPASGAGQIPTK
jgi:preprotein translocase subunit SecG